VSQASISKLKTTLGAALVQIMFKEITIDLNLAISVLSRSPQYLFEYLH
jgi:hypothetical protein